MQHSTMNDPPLLLFLFLAFYWINVDVAAVVENPFTPKAYVTRYWSKHISNDLPKPEFLLNKASPLTAAQSAAFTKLASDQNLLSTHLPDLCAKANLLCFSHLLSSTLQKQSDDANFTSYVNVNFTNYGTDRNGGVDSFQHYSERSFLNQDSFRRYSRNSIDHNDSFANYASDEILSDERFNSYATRAKGGEGKFNGYNDFTNARTLRFASYSDNTKERKQTFTQYGSMGNVGDQQFTSYGKNGKDAANEFTGYGQSSNVLGSAFTNYGEMGNRANDTFTSYSTSTNVPQNTFKNYASEGNAAADNFNSYKAQSNVGDDNFESYGKQSKRAKLGFTSYGQPGEFSNDGSDRFSGYANNATDSNVAFKIYNIVNSNFTGYAKKGVQFSTYVNGSSPVKTNSLADVGDKKVNKWVEPGKFFREEMLKSGTLMPMPDIRDKMPTRSFLPRPIMSKLPFSTSKIEDMKKIFHAADDSTMEKMLTDSLNECERAPSPDESKRCVASIEDMIDFATEVLGTNVVVRTTENTRGSNGNIMIGEVRGINGGKVTESVSCHQSLFPYLLYYCHSVPKVRVYEADILDPKSKEKINHGIAICHLDTSSWSSGHGAFVALGSSPGKIEVCHWIFENDMTWATAD